jgi:hypothetical protein
MKEHTVQWLVGLPKNQTPSLAEVMTAIQHDAFSVENYNAALNKTLVNLLLTRKPADLHGVIESDGVKIWIDGGNDELKRLNPAHFDSIEIIRKEFL